MRRIRSGGEERGQATVEFAIVIPLLLLLIVGLFEFGKTFNYWISLNHLANEGARWAAVDKVPPNIATPSGNDIKNYIKSQVLTGELQNNVGSNGIKLCFTGTSPEPQVGDAVTVRLAARNPIRLLSGVMNITIVGSATMRLERAPASVQQRAGWVPCT